MRSESLIHECRQDRRCKARTRDTENRWHGAGVERPDSLCHSCEQRAFDAIRQLPRDYQLLQAALTEETSRLSGPKVSGSSEPSIPINISADTLMAAITDECERWAAHLPWEGIELTVVCSHLGTLVDLPPQSVTVWVPRPDGGDTQMNTVMDGVDAVLRLARLHERAVQLLDLGPEQDEKLDDPCHVCGLAAVTASVKTQLVTCNHCRNVWHQDEFARLNNPLAAA